MTLAPLIVNMSGSTAPFLTGLRDFTHVPP